MKAVILAAGRGTRMGALTERTPKPMLEVRGKPILQHIIEGIRDIGVTDLGIVVGHVSHMVEERFGDGGALGVTISYTLQTTQDGTGSAAGLAEPFVGDEPFILTYGDILVAPRSYRDIVTRFGASDYAGVIAARAGEEVGRGGLLLFDDTFCLHSLVEKPAPDEVAELRSKRLLRDGDPIWYNAGIYLFRPLVFEFTRNLTPSPRGEFELTDAVVDMVEAGHKLAGVEITGAWNEVGDPQSLAEANQRTGTGQTTD